VQIVRGEDDVTFIHRNNRRAPRDRQAPFRIRVHSLDQRHQRTIRVPSPTSLVQPDTRLTPLARLVLHSVSAVPMRLLDEVRIRPASRNWLRAPWYGYHRGGAITIGRTIWFTRKWFKAEGYGDGSLRATWNWLQHLSHEVGHLPQAARFGPGLWGKARYVSAFTAQYGIRALMLRKRIHDGAPLEIEADRGRWILLRLMGDAPLAQPLVRALHTGDVQAVREHCANLAEAIADFSRSYDDLHPAR
jgi:hypothetical protein